MPRQIDKRAGVGEIAHGARPAAGECAVCCLQCAACRVFKCVSVVVLLCVSLQERFGVLLDAGSGLMAEHVLSTAQLTGSAEDRSATARHATFTVIASYKLGLLLQLHMHPELTPEEWLLFQLNHDLSASFFAAIYDCFRTCKNMYSMESRKALDYITREKVGRDFVIVVDNAEALLTEDVYLRTVSVRLPARRTAASCGDCAGEGASEAAQHCCRGRVTPRKQSAAQRLLVHAHLR